MHLREWWILDSWHGMIRRLVHDRINLLWQLRKEGLVSIQLVAQVGFVFFIGI